MSIHEDPAMDTTDLPNEVQRLRAALAKANKNASRNRRRADYFKRQLIAAGIEPKPLLAFMPPPPPGWEEPDEP